MGNQQDRANDQRDTAIAILEKVGAIELCECGNSYVEGDKPEAGAYAYANTHLSEYLPFFDSKQQLFDEISQAYADNSGDECSECTPHDND